MSSTTRTQFLVALGNTDNSLVWSEFCSRYRPMLVSFGRRLGLQEQDAEDAAQETVMAFLATYREDRYRRQQGRLRSWLYGIASNKIRDIQRRRMRECPLGDSGGSSDLFEQLADDHTMSEIWDLEWQRAVLSFCIQEVRREVSPTSLQVFDRCVLKKESPDEVAASLDMTRDAVLKAKTRVLSRIREIRQTIEHRW